MKKTLATLLVLAMVASVFCMMVVPASAAVSGEGNLAAGKKWTGDTDCGTEYVGDVTDGAIETEGKYDKTLWYGADRRLTDDDTFTMIIDLEEVYNNIAEVKAFVWPAGYSGIMIPASIDFYASEDGEEYFELGSITEFESTDPHWVTVALESVITARYIRIDMAASADTSVFWFVAEVEVNAGEAPVADREPSVISVSHVNCYTWGVYNSMVMTEVGKNCTNSSKVAYPCDWWYAFLVEDIDGVYTVTDIEGSGETKTNVVPEGGFILYVYSNDAASWAAAEQIQVGDVMLDCTVDWSVDVASETAVGTMTFGVAGELPEKPKAPVYADVLDGSVKVPSDADLLKLIDGNLAADATAFGDAGLIAFQNTGFEHGVEDAVPATVAVTADLGEVKTIAKASLSAFLDSASMIALPEVRFEVSVDGINFYDINAGGVVKPAADAAEATTATLTADFSTRIAVSARYVRVIASFTNGWIFLSEISVTEAGAYTAVAPDAAIPYTDSELSGNGVGVFDAEDGELDLAARFKNSQLIKAVYDAEKDAYKVIYSKVNPWPDGNTGYETMGEGEIFIAINTGGALVAEADDATIAANLYCAAKWLARGLTEGDYLVIDEEAATISFYPAEGNLGKVEEDEPEVPGDNAVAELEEALKELVGEAVEDPAYGWALEVTVDETGKVTVVATLSNVDAAQLQCIEGTLHYDATVLTLLTGAGSENELLCLTEPAGSAGKWENMSTLVEDGNIRLGAATFDTSVVLTDADPMVFTLEFQLAEGETLTGMYIDTPESYGMNVDGDTVHGNGAYGILEVETEEEPSTPSTPEEDSSDDVPAGDAGILVFAVLGILAIAGAAVVIKVRN